MRWHPGSQICLLLLMHAVGNVAGLNFTQCLIDIVANANATQNLAGLLDGNGDPVSNAFDATSITYALCTSACGKGQEPFQWSVFSQDLGSWLLPNLALISQLPFGGEERPHNFMAAVLTVGSPVLAGYSLLMTLLNSIWIKRKFNKLKKNPETNSSFAASILSNLQQVPLRLNPDLVKSLIVLPENDCWLKCLSEFVDYTHTWSFAPATAIAWVVVAFVISVVNSPVELFISSQADGTATGSLWLWLIPIVVGWLQLSPKCDFFRLEEAYKRANQHAHAGCRHMKTSTEFPTKALTITAKDNDVSSPDEHLTPPVFNYSRSFRWASTAHMMFLEFEAASEEEAQNSTLVSFPIPIQQSESSESSETLYPPTSFGEIPRDAHCSRWAPYVVLRMVAASCASLALQWGTAGAAFLTAWFTPTTRMGCRSMSYLIYAGLSTLVWMMLLASSVLAHYSVPFRDTYPASNLYRALSNGYGPLPVTQNNSDPFDYLSKQKRLPAGRNLARKISNLLRWAGKALAIANSIWLVLSCIFVYSNFYDTCFCNGSVISRGEAAYTVIIETAAQAAQLKAASIGALAMACVTSFLFIVIVNLW
ncbi:hypothetical protein DEU56DRAFT_783933 [Suillus clintonianus]|uniref:uncharacterized protein n=1 Tax=Suillus clintonianus TaxID=1904413 RepID=UPI001B863C52|nr:uncharacterized protein DEU56DRAFT_783933 [Suillus clintonianus]KAG2148058.1 hypothetical protein DEU56DRAFT_783933 [Suillus clintonianus]